MSIPSLHSPVVSTIVPSASITASSKKESGCCFQTLVNHAKSGRVNSAVDELREGARWMSTTEGGQLRPSADNELNSLMKHGFATQNPWRVNDKVKIDRVTWDAGGRNSDGNRVAIRVKTSSRSKAFELYRRLGRDKRFIRRGQVGGRARLECGPPSAKTLVLCFGF